MKKKIILLCTFMVLLSGCSNKNKEEEPTAVDTIAEYVEISTEEISEVEETTTEESYLDRLSKYEKLLLNVANVDDLLNKGSYKLSIYSIENDETELCKTCYATRESAGYIESDGLMRISKGGCTAEYYSTDNSYTAIVNVGEDDLFYKNYNQSWCDGYLLGNEPIVGGYELIDDCMVEIYYHYDYIEGISMKALIDLSCNQLISTTTLFDGIEISECIVEPLDKFPDELTDLWNKVYMSDDYCTVTCNFIGGTFTESMSYEIGKGCKVLPYVNYQYDYRGYKSADSDEYFNYSDVIYSDVDIFYKEM